MGYVYAFRHGHEDEFKFGQTSNLEQRLKSLQTGCPKPLTLFDCIETDDYKDGEKFILRRLAHKRLTGELRRRCRRSTRGHGGLPGLPRKRATAMERGRSQGR